LRTRTYNNCYPILRVSAKQGLIDVILAFEIFVSYCHCINPFAQQSMPFLIMIIIILIIKIDWLIKFINQSI